MENMENVLMQKYEFGKMFGQGNFAKVYHARNLESGQNIAVKVIDKEKVLKVGLIDQTKREISVMRMVRHPNIIQLYEVMATKNKIYFAMEYAKGGELFDKVVKGRLKEDIARKYFQQLILAVDFCHSRRVYHRDIKPENLLLDEYGNLKVTDFGLSVHQSCTHLDGLLHTTCGTPAYVAPEVISRRGYDGAKSDIWSCGVVLFVLLTGQLPFNDSNIMQLYKKISRAEYKCTSSLPPDVRKLLKRILDPNPITRISMKKIMENSWFKEGLDTHSDHADVTMEKIMENSLFKEGLDLHSGHVDMTPYIDQKKPELTKVSSFNAFDIISLSTGFDLSGLFVENDEKDEVKFTSLKPASDIISKMEEIASSLKMEVGMNKGGLLKFKKASESRNSLLLIDVEIFEITSCFHLVEVKKSGGDAFEYREMMKNDIKPALQGFVFAWHGE
ncbi:CBL-interacting protein kinase 2-like [Bidens hawaiensis]|uniref:CBL-interacting protein kinase 2-like n=1 Tax=Bidens hawaiensis TaxID=980011 RepID=UPI00404B501D